MINITVTMTEMAKYGNINMGSKEWTALSYEEKNRMLFLRQKNTLDLFLERGAISQVQYDKSLQDLMEKTGISIESDDDRPNIMIREISIESH